MVKKLKCINGTTLKLLAMALMLCDHIWGAGLLPYNWLTLIGRIAFPIFAFQVAEGYAKTHDFWKYTRRMLLFALISEIPFNYVIGGGPTYLFHQNVMFTFLIALLVMRGIDQACANRPGTVWKAFMVLCFGTLGFAVGSITCVDYFGAGVLTVLLFWLTRETPWGWVWQLLGMWVINWKILGGFSYVLHLGSAEFWVPVQAFALLALIPIWLYNGKKGPGGKPMQYFGYAFYPLHLTILAILPMIFG